MNAEVQIQFQVEGFHVYPDAPTKVNFLSHEHRHTFIISCGFRVYDLNREQEIFILRNIVMSYLQKEFADTINKEKQTLQFGAMSCEMIAYDILKQHTSQYNMIWCQVWEENTGGAKVSI